MGTTLWDQQRGYSRRYSWSTAVLPKHPTTASDASVSFQRFYLDDGTIGGSADDIIRDLRIVEYEVYRYYKFRIKPC